MSSVSFAVASDLTGSLKQRKPFKLEYRSGKGRKSRRSGVLENRDPPDARGADSYRIDGDGLHTYDALEFQTLREHNLECVYSSHSL
jgi:hypothetical protein